MNRLILAAALAVGCTLASSAPALGAARNYDCSKAGNANKAACKGGAKPAPAAAKAAPAHKAAPAKTAAAAAPAASPGILQRMSNALHGSPPTPPARKAAAPKRSVAAAPASADDHNPAGAIAQCKDGSYSHAKARSGACARHGGVAKWS
jgi:hypothetical protein